MSGFAPSGLAVSLPAREVRNTPLPGALFGATELLEHAISPALRGAVRALSDLYKGAPDRLVFISRPEMFTHGDTLGWLRGRLGGIADHVCLSDGSVIHLVPGLENHVFLYDTGRDGTAAALEALAARAPELWPQLACQLNSRLCFGGHTPRPVLAQPESFPFLGEPGLHRFYLNPNSVEDSVARIMLAPALDPGFLEHFTEVTYVPFTGAAATDEDFCESVAALLLRILRTPERALVLGAPDDSDTAALALGKVLHGLKRNNIVLPRAMLDNVVLASAFLGDGYFTGKRTARLVLHGSFGAWRCPKSYYRRFARVHAVAAEHDLAAEATGPGFMPGWPAEVTKEAAHG